MSVLSRAREKLAVWKRDPVRMVVDELGADPDPWQVDFLRAFPTKNRLGLKACKGPGKTAVLSWCAWNFLATRPHPKIAATSITAENLADNLWTEMAKWQNESQFLTEAFRWNKKRITSRDHPETWWMAARSWPKTGDKNKQAGTLAGLHADYLLFILDESGGIPMSVMVTADAGLATGIETKIIQAGNPDHLEGPLYAASTNERHLWYLIEITGDPDDPKRASRVNLQWAKEQIEKYGRDNPWVMVNVLGQFPPSSINALLGPEDVSAAMKRIIAPAEYMYAEKRLGVDFARFGDDMNVIFPRQGRASFRPAEMRNARSEEIASRIAAARDRWGSEVEFGDSTGGYSIGVEDILNAAGRPIVPVNFSSKADDSRYYNKRAEIHFRTAEWVKRGGCLPNLPQLSRELTALTYTYKDSKFLVESKEQIKEKLNGHSPDYADALATTFAWEERPMGAGLMVPANLRQQASVKHEYDPHNSQQSVSHEYNPHD